MSELARETNTVPTDRAGRPIGAPNVCRRVFGCARYGARKRWTYEYYCADEPNISAADAAVMITDMPMEIVLRIMESLPLQDKFSYYYPGWGETA